MSQTPEHSIEHWARSLGLDINDPRVQHYAHGGKVPTDSTTLESSAGDIEEIDHGATSEDPRFVEAVRHYAESQGLDIYDQRVVKYAIGLKKRQSSFAEEGRDLSHPEPSRRHRG